MAMLRLEGDNETMLLPSICNEYKATEPSNDTTTEEKSLPWSWFLVLAKAKTAVQHGARRLEQLWRGQASRSELLAAITVQVPSMASDAFRTSGDEFIVANGTSTRP